MNSAPELSIKVKLLSAAVAMALLDSSWRPNVVKWTPMSRLFHIVLLTMLAVHAQAVSFTNDVAPILVQKCLICHGAERSKGGYRVDTFEALLKPGSSKEPPVSQGQPEKSQLY
jgi:hypothetical protein